MKFAKSFVACAAVSAGAFAFPAESRADVLFFTDEGDYTARLVLEGLAPFEEQVHFNLAGAVNGPAGTVTGVGVDTLRLVDFTSDEDLRSGGTGNAFVQGDDDTLTTLDITPNGFGGFKAFSFEIEPEPENDKDGTYTLTATDQFGDETSATRDNDPGGNDFFGAIAINGQVITKLNLISTGTQIGAIRHIEMVVPLPAAVWGGMALFGGMGGIQLFRRRRIAEL